MFFIFGQRNFGKVDRVPGAFYVVTQFFHINFLPLIPTATYVVVEGSESGGRFHGKKISMSFRSILTAWSRFALIVGLLISGGIAFFTLLGGMADGNPEMLTTGAIMAVVSVASGVAFWLTYRMAHASHHRALQLADELGMSHAFVMRCLDPNRSRADLPELEMAGSDDRDYDRRDRERDYDRRDRDYEAPDRDYDRRDY